jgi:NAD(P)-dependent dehydrogenase (short-subunit alcohol dehydrogenase family)
MREFRGRTAVITGAASGLGWEFSRRAVSLGMNVVMADVDAPLLERCAKLLSAEGALVLPVLTDVADASQVDLLADRAFAQFGAVHLLFNNAGVAPVGLLWETPVEDWKWAMGVNVMGVANGIRSFIPRMLGQGESSHVVNTASVAGLIAPTTMGLYNATKHAVVAISETLYHDLKAVGSRTGVTVLCPAFVPTGIADSDRNRPASLRPQRHDSSEQTRKAKLALERAVSSGRLSAAEVAKLAFEAVEEDRFYALTHPAILSSVKARHDAILGGTAPNDPFSRRPGLSPAGLKQ